MAGKELDAETKAYLETLPAVESVMSGRIYYNDAFKDYVVQRCDAGDSPTRIFRAAGLGPSVIGRKRIERCVARWRRRAARAEASRAEVSRSGAVPLPHASRGSEASIGIGADPAGLTGVDKDATAIAASGGGNSDGVDVSGGSSRTSSPSDMPFVPGAGPSRVHASGSASLAVGSEPSASDFASFAVPAVRFAPKPSSEPFAPRASEFGNEPFAPVRAIPFGGSDPARQDASLATLNRRIENLELLLRQQLLHMQRLEDDLSLLRSRLTSRQ